MRENIVWPMPGELDVVSRRAPARPETFKPFDGDGSFLPLGRGARYNVTGMAHDADGFPVQGAAAGRQLRRLVGKVQGRTRELAHYEAKYLDDAKLVIVSYGVTTRAAAEAVERLRQEGIAAGLLDLKTLWPFPDFLIEDIASRAESILVPELNMGQVVREVTRAALGRCPVRPLGRVDGYLLSPEEVVEAARQCGREPGHAGLQGAAS
jgi:2-oxoglutarate/2-oxoacid ferredoxin oxidoreductase subunit alpha